MQSYWAGTLKLIIIIASINHHRLQLGVLWSSHLFYCCVLEDNFLNHDLVNAPETHVIYKRLTVHFHLNGHTQGIVLQ